MSAITESPKVEMQRKLRVIAGPAYAGEKDDQLRARAVRRMNAGLAGDRHISDSRGKRYWYAEIDDVPSDHMDRVRELAFVQPLQEAQDAVERAEAFLEGLRSRLAASAGTAVRRVGTGGGSVQPRRAVRSTSDGDRLPSGFSPPLILSPMS